MCLISAAQFSMTSQKSGAYLSDSKSNVKLFFSLFSSFLITTRFYWEKILLFLRRRPLRSLRSLESLKSLRMAAPKVWRATRFFKKSDYNAVFLSFLRSHRHSGEGPGVRWGLPCIFLYIAVPSIFFPFI